jgi:dCMP deaminase
MEIDLWDQRFLELATFISGWSKDPSTKVGAVITSGIRVVSVGYNGFPQGVDDLPHRLNDRKFKYPMVVHGDANAILFAKGQADGGTLYTIPFPPCSTCTGLAIQAGIVRIVAPSPSREIAERWGESLALAEMMCREAGVRLDIFDWKPAQSAGPHCGTCA